MYSVPAYYLLSKVKQTTVTLTTRALGAKTGYLETTTVLLLEYNTIFFLAAYLKIFDLQKIFVYSGNNYEEVCFSSR